jgi:hypothetical protein
MLLGLCGMLLILAGVGEMRNPPSVCMDESAFSRDIRSWLDKKAEIYLIIIIIVILHSNC